MPPPGRPATLTRPVLHFLLTTSARAFMPPGKWRDVPSPTRTDINYFSPRPAELTVQLPSRRQLILCLPSGPAFLVRRRGYNSSAGLSTSGTADFMDFRLTSKNAGQMRRRGATVGVRPSSSCRDPRSRPPKGGPRPRGPVDVGHRSHHGRHRPQSLRWRGSHLYVVISAIR